ncbi:fungal specific transcription factor domain-containing protein [Aspergillus saccharolyticus JOP 1030-1]|uniref:Xylanolytic transcriptional activator regulatory domain-containing protein n=1 Tax=Aspergillus saccharolyticus JOP 1030-1 TaxID=1450539 RepID=A0A318ZC55_9EURO|nr:hypothetical protein BP01DRAFT_303707 [Aspergillus saccharolyticus JOP 1030-1]PYH42273.1 hypothetical protein BP01DRAFT_303707 [Aspergillus saccharolyticus JOP 1030-1]
MLTTIAPSQKSLESNLQYWLVFLRFVVQKLDLHRDDQGLDQEDREERRRLWWATYIIDRHVALSFNGRPRLTDQECSYLPVPCPDAVWDQMSPLPQLSNDVLQSSESRYQLRSLDMLGTFLPLSSRILGDILEYRFLDDHPTFSSNKALLDTSRKVIIQNLRLWLDSFESLVEPSFCRIAEPGCELMPSPNAPAVAYYGLHMYHCMFVLLHGRMDVVRMYHDLEWQASADFLTAGEHAVACANVASHILRVDPQLSFMYRYFGTYFLQSSFIFLILAQKLGQKSDKLILRNCAINLQVLDQFVLATNMDYQRTFAKLLRKALSYNMKQHSPDQAQDGHGDTSPLEELQSNLDPEMLRYRWTPGFTGLWAHGGP